MTTEPWVSRTGQEIADEGARLRGFDNADGLYHFSPDFSLDDLIAALLSGADGRQERIRVEIAPGEEISITVQSLGQLYDDTSVAPDDALHDGCDYPDWEVYGWATGVEGQTRYRMVLMTTWWSPVPDGVLQQALLKRLP